jgi:hypothetical protein
MAHFAPALAERVAPRAPGDAAHVAAALAALLDAVADEGPVLLALDDAHWADGATLGALRGALRGLAARPVGLVLGAFDDVASWPPELAALVRDVAHAVAGTAVTLGPLGEDEVRDLVAALWREGPDEASRRAARRLATECGGSPFLAVTLLRALVASRTFADDLAAWPPVGRTMDAPLPEGVSGAVRLAVLTELAGLSPGATHTAAATALAGVAVDAALLVTATRLPEPEVEAALAELERRRILAFRDGRYAFSAALVAAIVRREGLPAGRREALRGRLADALEARGDLEGRVAAMAVRAPHGPSPQLFEAAVRATREGLAGGARRTARRSLGIAEVVVDLADTDAQRTLDDLRRSIEQLTPAPTP